MYREYFYWADYASDPNFSDQETAELEPETEEDEIQKQKIERAKNPFYSEISRGVNRLRSEDAFCDVVIKAGEYAIPAHKVILCACSPYFNAMFNGKFFEKSSNEVTLLDIDNEALQILINYIYTGELSYGTMNVERILLMSRFLQIDSAEDICANFLIQNITINNCFNLIRFAGKHSIKIITDSLIKFITKHFNLLYTKNDFLLIEYEELTAILSAKETSLYPDDSLFAMILRWVDCNRETRIQYLNELLNNINAAHVTKELLASPTLHEYTEEKDLEKWLSDHDPVNLDDLSNWDLIVMKRLGHFQPKLFKLNSTANGNIPELPKQYFDGSFVSYGSSIYYQGGCLSKRPVCCASFAFNIYKNKWTPFIPLKKARGYHRSCVMNGCIYSCGGSDGYRAMKSVEMLDLISGKQSFLPDMHFPREEMGITHHENSIYVFGGRNRGMNQYYCGERYDARVGKWEFLAPNPYQIGVSSSAVIGDSIYCMSSKEIMSMPRFDIRKNEWTLIYTQYDRYPYELFAINNHLFGLFKENTAEYEYNTGKWKIVNTFGFSQNNLTVLPVTIAPPQTFDFRRQR